jgi:cobalt-zinc-cadmium resistance protein CzcA
VSEEIFFSISIIILAYLPIFTFQRIEAKLFTPMAFTLSFAIAGSLLLALTIIPVLMTLLYRKHFESVPPKKIGRDNPIYLFIEKMYGKLSIFLINHSTGAVITAFSFVAFIGILGYEGIGTEFLPNLDEGSVNIRCFLPVGITLDQSDKYAGKIRNILSEFKPVKTVISQTGRNDDGTDPYGPNRLEVLVLLNDYKTWTSEISKDDLLDSIKNKLEANIPGGVFSFSQPILDNVTEAVTGSVADFAVMIGGNDLAFMRKTADTILNIIKDIPGATEYGIEQEGNQSQLTIEVDRQAAARFGMNVSDLQRMIEAAIGGSKVSSLYDGQKKFDIVVRYSSEYRGSIEAVQNMTVTSSTGARIPMSSLANIVLKDGPTIVQRSDGKRLISVRTNIHERDQGGFAKEAMEKVGKAIHLPKGYTLEWGGQFSNLERAGKRLAIVVPLTILIIFLLLFKLYRNFRHAGVALAAIPLSMTGGILALLIRGYNINVSAGVGFISLFGISIMSGVLYVSRARKILDKEKLPLKEATLKAAVIQLRPGLMAMLLALLGLIPASMASGIGSDVQRVLASVIVGGLTTAILVTTVILPPLFYFVESKLNYVRPEPDLADDEE